MTETSAAQAQGGDLPRQPTKPHGSSATVRLLTSLAVGVAVGAATAVPASWRYGLLLGWMAGAATFVVWMWMIIWPMQAPDTAQHAVREDSRRAATDIVFIVAAVASLGAVGLLLTSSSGGNKNLAAGLSLSSIFLAWATVHSIFTTRYARLYYTGADGGIDFNEKDPPRYSDFAYLAFTIGMTFQVSDTDLSTKEIRRTALGHALLSYLFGTVIIASTINLIAGLAK